MLQASTLFSVLRKQPDLNTAPWPCVSPAAKQLLSGMLQKEPDKRLSLNQVGGE